MKNDNAGTWGQPGGMGDALTELLRHGARGLIEQAVETELLVLLEQYANVTDLAGRQAVVRNGYLPEREILTGVGPVPVKVPRIRDRGCSPNFLFRLAQEIAHPAETGGFPGDHLKDLR